MENDKLEIVFVKSIEDDFIKYDIDDEQIVKIETKLKVISKNIFSFSEKLVNLPNNFRKVRFGDYRLFVLIKEYTIYCLGYIHRRECYKRESLNKIITLVKNIDGKP